MRLYFQLSSFEHQLLILFKIFKDMIVCDVTVYMCVQKTTIKKIGNNHICIDDKHDTVKPTRKILSSLSNIYFSVCFMIRSDYRHAYVWSTSSQNNIWLLGFGDCPKINLSLFPIFIITSSHFSIGFSKKKKIWRQCLINSIDENCYDTLSFQCVRICM